MDSDFFRRVERAKRSDKTVFPSELIIGAAYEKCSNEILDWLVEKEYDSVAQALSDEFGFGYVVKKENPQSN